MKSPVYYLLLPVTALILSSWAPPVPFAPDKRITASDSLAEMETVIAVHPADSAELALSYIEMKDTAATCRIYYSKNGGLSWTKSAFDPQSINIQDYPQHTWRRTGDPALAWDRNGRLYGAWLSVSMSQPDATAYQVSYAYSDDGGQTWTVPAGAAHVVSKGLVDEMTSLALPVFEGHCDRHALAVDNTGGPDQGRLYCSYSINRAASNLPGDVGLYVRSKPAGGTTFGGPAPVYKGIWPIHAYIEVAPDAGVHLCFVEANSSQIMHASSGNAGQSFGQAHTVAAGSFLMGPLQTQLQYAENGAPHLAIDEANNLHMVWTSFPPAGFDAYYSKSVNGGSTWSAPVNIGAFFPPGSHAHMPNIAAFGSGVTIASTVAGPDDSAHYYHILSKNKGASFESPVRLSAAATWYPYYEINQLTYDGIGFGHYNRSVRNRCRSYTAWSDGRGNIGPRIYFAATSGCAGLAVPEVTAVTHQVQMTALYPVPAGDAVTLKFSAQGRQRVQLVLQDAAGSRVAHREMITKAGNSEQQLPLSGINAGVYVLKVFSGSTLIASRSLIKQ